VVTNHHVAGKTNAIVCTLSSREEIPAELVGTDPLSDIAVIKLKPAQPRRFPVATFGSATSLRVGDRVLALGSPLALSQSVTMGIVSNTEMIMPQLFWPFNRMTLEGEDVGSLVRWIGHDAAIFGGNSGGPLRSALGWPAPFLRTWRRTWPSRSSKTAASSAAGSASTCSRC
jgi:serine protease Do